jgi:MFS family permease
MPALNSELSPPTPEEVIELCQKLKTHSATRRRGLGLVIAALAGGMILSIVGSFSLIGKFASPPWQIISGLALLASGFAGAVMLVLPSELIRVAKRLEKSADPNVIPPLIDALVVARQISTNSATVQQLRRTLAILLRRLSPEASSVLSEENWRVLHQHMSAQAMVMPRLLIDANDLAFTLAILDLIARRRDTPYIGTVRSISYAFGVRERQLREAVRACLVVLEEQQKKEQESQMLLRASTPANQSETLLRPATPGSTTDAQELLRPNAS